MKNKTADEYIPKNRAEEMRNLQAKIKDRLRDSVIRFEPDRTTTSRNWVHSLRLGGRTSGKLAHKTMRPVIRYVKELDAEHKAEMRELNKKLNEDCERQVLKQVKAAIGEIEERITERAVIYHEEGNTYESEILEEALGEIDQIKMKYKVE